MVEPRGLSSGDRRGRRTGGGWLIHGAPYAVVRPLVFEMFVTVCLRTHVCTDHLGTWARAYPPPSPPPPPLFGNCGRLAKHATTFSDTRSVSEQLSGRSAKCEVQRVKTGDAERRERERENGGGGQKTGVKEHRKLVPQSSARIRACARSYVRE